MMLVISTQCYENYGTETDPYWKAKGGSEYKILGVPTDVDLDEVVTLVRGDIEKSNDYVQETIIGYGMEADDYLSDFERSQLEYDGDIEFPEPFIEYSDLCVA
jgi:hypothetical protein